MSAPELDLYAIHKLCMGNEQRLQVAAQAGCFDCMSIFPAIDVTAWIDDKPVRSALCPKCSSDAVLADDGIIPFSTELLQGMHSEYFGIDPDNSTTYNSFADALEAYQQSTKS